MGCSVDPLHRVFHRAIHAGAERAYPQTGRGSSTDRRRAAVFHVKPARRPMFHVKRRPPGRCAPPPTLLARTTTYDDHATPLAQAAQHSVLARTGGLRRQGMPRPQATRVFVVANQKGGVGKTTSTVNVAAGLAQLGQRVLVIDLDPQGNASTALERRAPPRECRRPTTCWSTAQPLADVMTECADLPGLWVVPATIDLAGAEIELVSVVAREQRLAQGTARPTRGSARAEDVGEDRFDYVLVDCPPSLGPAHAQRAGRRARDVHPDPGGVLRPRGSRPAARDGRDGAPAPQPAARSSPRSCSRCTTPAPGSRPAWPTRCASHFGDQVLKTAVPRSVRVSEAPSYGQTVMTYDPASAGALSYLEAAREIATKGAPA